MAWLCNVCLSLLWSFNLRIYPYQFARDQGLYKHTNCLCRKKPKQNFGFTEFPLLCVVICHFLTSTNHKCISAEQKIVICWSWNSSTMIWNVTRSWVRNFLHLCSTRVTTLWAPANLLLSSDPVLLDICSIMKSRSNLGVALEPLKLVKRNVSLETLRKDIL